MADEVFRYLNSQPLYLTYPIPPLKSDPMVVKILEANSRSRMIAQPQSMSVLTHHPTPVMGMCVLLESQPQSLIFEAKRSIGLD
jgi:hypothetical protein